MHDNQGRPVIAVLGMGKMGHALAGRLLDQGWSVRLWNRSPRDLSAHQSRGAIALDSLDRLWDHAQVVITFVANDEALSAVCLGDDSVLRSGPEGRTLIDMSTISPSLSSEISTRAASSGVDYLRSPVSGNPAVLAAGNITLLISGPRETFEHCEELLRSIGPTVLYVGDAEQSRTLKLAINAGLAVTAQVMAELIVLAEHNGIERSALLQALGESVMGSPFIRYKTPGLVEHDYSATFTTNLLAKDLDLALDVAHANELLLPMIELARSLTRVASESGYGEIDFAALLPSLQLTHGHTPDVAPSS